MLIAKLGGSLLSLPDLKSRVERWLATTEEPALILPGGGQLVDRLRELAERFSLSEVTCHWQAIRLMSVQSTLVGELLGPSFPLLVLTPALAIELKDNGLRRSHAVIDPRPLLEANPEALPTNWQTTSDSIAAFVAHRTGARRLVLLKSVGESSTTIGQAEQKGWIDPNFVQAVGSLPVDWVNLAAI